MTREEEIAQGCSQGDREAQKILYETYAGTLLGMSLRYVGDSDIAQDLLHDGFVQILTHFQQFKWRGEGSLKARLCQVQQNVILTHLRQRERFEVLSIDDDPQAMTEIPDPETAADVPQSVLLRFISDLPVGYRTVFNMYVIDGCSHREIAQQLGINERSSASQLLHARRQLAQKINQWRKENL